MIQQDSPRESASYLGGVEKAYVRENCWVPLLRQRRERCERRVKYLTLPGRQLTEIRRFAEEKIIEGPNDVVLVERDLMDYYHILREATLLPYRYRVEPITVINGDLDDLILGGKLSSFSPFDAVNLDYCGFIWGTDNISSRKWKAVKSLIQTQAHAGIGNAPHSFTLFLTVQGRGGAGATVDDALLEYRAEVGAQWDAIAAYPYHAKLLYALPLMITHAGFRFDYDMVCTHRFVYRPLSITGSATMLAFGFTFELPPVVSDASSVTRRIAELEAERCTGLLSTQPIRLHYDTQTQQLREQLLDPTLVQSAQDEEL